jgi:hypothetical protein
MVEGRIVRLSPRQAEIAGPETMPAMTNLVLRLAAGSAENVDFYAKSVAGPAGGVDRFLVRFTSLPDVVRAALGPAARR